MKLTKKITLLVILGIAMMIPTSVHASFQSVPGKFNSATVNNFFLGCRQMETEGGVLGLRENLNEDYTGSTGNGIDSHMVLNTEWGTVALFTNSMYGIGAGISENKSSTSTGNATGIYNLANNPESTASLYNGRKNSYNNIMGSANSRYSNDYLSQYFSYKSGDALECKGWLGSNDQMIWWGDNDNRLTLYRGSNGIFSVSGLSYDTRASRAVVVCAEGL